MTVTWLELRRPLDPGLDRLLWDIHGLLKPLGIPYLMAGAMAREILLHYGHGCVAGRKTKDVDFGVTVADWDAYAFLLGSLERSGRFRRGDQAQRMIHLDAVSGLETPVDLVPFGAIADATGTLSWPPDGDKTMRVLGYEQALAHATMLKLDATRAVPMASPAGLAILKLVAWLDRGLVFGGKDAVDFMELLYHQEEILSDAELYDEFPEALDAYDYRPEPVAAWILGRRVAECMTSVLATTLKTVFQKETRTTFLNHALREYGMGDNSARADQAELMLGAFEAGFQMGRAPISWTTRRG